MAIILVNQFYSICSACLLLFSSTSRSIRPLLCLRSLAVPPFGCLCVRKFHIEKCIGSICIGFNIFLLVPSSGLFGMSRKCFSKKWKMRKSNCNILMYDSIQIMCVRVLRVCGRESVCKGVCVYLFWMANAYKCLNKRNAFFFCLCMFALVIFHIK